MSFEYHTIKLSRLLDKHLGNKLILVHIEIFSVYIQTMWISLSRSDLHHTFVRLYFDSLVCPHSFESKKNKVELLP